ncbi:hypothetical protein [Lacrimispora sp.]|uniref:hypothetical protein n=1 Tax=Lacrimispora sp. TaxID=2719234 RepID=UPI0028B17BF3|nr:hypothetical protein [Lacrimispora sp.]
MRNADRIARYIARLMENPRSSRSRLLFNIKSQTRTTVNLITAVAVGIRRFKQLRKLCLRDCFTLILNGQSACP